MEAGDGIGLRLSRLQGQNTTFYRVFKATRRVSKITPKPQSGVRFGVRWFIQNSRKKKWGLQETF